MENIRKLPVNIKSEMPVYLFGAMRQGPSQGRNAKMGTTPRIQTRATTFVFIMVMLYVSEPDPQLSFITSENNPGQGFWANRCDLIKLNTSGFPNHQK